MTYDQVTQAVDNGEKVHWHNEGYIVIKDRLERYLVIFTANEYTTGLQESDCQQCFIGGEQ